MKKSNCFAVAAILALFFAAAAPVAEAYIYNLTYSCIDGCIPKTGVEFNLTIFKGGGEAFQINEINIIQSGGTIDSGYEKLIANFNRTPFIVYQKETLILNGTLPLFSGSRFLNVSPCFTVQIEPRNRMADERFIGFERSYCEKHNISIPFYQCIDAGQCEERETCKENTCLQINCSQCQYVSAHSCRDYECCSDSQCKESSKCSEGKKCVPVNCTAGFMPTNHACTQISCEPDEFFSEGGCKKLSCKETEQLSNHTCMPLECSWYTLPQNHNCAKILLEVELKTVQEVITAEKSQPERLPTQATEQKKPGLQEIAELLALALILSLVILIINRIYWTKNKAKTLNNSTRGEKT
jgi:hypothetical protein